MLVHSTLTAELSIKISVVSQPTTALRLEFLNKFLEEISPFRGATDTSVLNFY